jgi:hypothetical protein
VSKVLSTLTVTPASPTLATGIQQQFLAVGTYNDGSTADVTGSVTWSSSSPSVATVTTGGVVSAVAAGSTNIVATTGTISGSTALTVPSVSGGLVLYTNPTDPLILSGVGSDGSKVSFYGTRDASGVPQTFYAVTQTLPNGTKQRIELDAQSRPVYAYDSRGIQYELDWTSATQGVITAVTLDGTKVVSAPFDLSSASPAAVLPTGSAQRAERRSSKSLIAPTSALTVNVVDDCLPSVPEWNAKVMADMSTDTMAFDSVPAQNNYDGSYTVYLPTPTTSIIGTAALTAQQNAANIAAGNYCQNKAQQNVSTLCSVISTAAYLFPDIEPVVLETCGAVGVGSDMCTAANKINSWLDRYTSVAVAVTATASTSSDLGTSQTEVGIWGEPDTFDPLSIKLNCRVPAYVTVNPNSFTLSTGQISPVRADLFDADDIYISNSAFTVSWQTSNPDVALVPATGLSGQITGVNPGPATVTATAISTSPANLATYGTPGTAAVNVQGGVNLTVTWNTAPDGTDPSGNWTGTETLTISNGSWLFSGNLTNPASGCFTTRTEAGSGLYADPATPTPSAPFTFTLSLPASWTNTNAASGCENQGGNGTSFTGSESTPEVTVLATPVAGGGYSLSTSTVYPPESVFGGSQTTVTATGTIK